MPNCKETKGRGFAAPSEPEAPPTFRLRACSPIPCWLPLCIGTQRFRSEVNHQISQTLSVTLSKKEPDYAGTYKFELSFYSGGLT